MAEEQEAAVEIEEKPAPPPKLSKGPLILALLNTLAVLGAGGTYAYTQILFKRKPITEIAERARIEKKIKTIKEPELAVIPASVTIPPFTANVSASKLPPGTKPNSKFKGKPHFLTLGFSLVIRDGNKLEKFNKIKPKFMDQVLQMLGRKGYQDLNSVQGRYILRSNFVDLANKLLKEPLIKTVWFTTFVIQ